jgi:hypothetical protein
MKNVQQGVKDRHVVRSKTWEPISLPLEQGNFHRMPPIPAISKLNSNISAMSVGGENETFNTGKQVTIGNISRLKSYTRNFFLPNGCA